MYRAPRGTADILPKEQKYWRYIEATARALSHRYGYRRLDTPLFEHTGLFVRGMGQGTDIVEKEMYSFQDHGGDSLTLRPEGTAPVCRAYLEHGMGNQPQPIRMCYFSPAFRYERPQAGRYRQHHQFGVESLGDADPAVDAEIVEMAWQLMKDLGLKALRLLINTIGDSNCRPAYLEHLKSYCASRVMYMCQDCRGRLERNPLRLLDCKQETCQTIAQEAPRSIDHLCSDCQDHWDTLLGYLQRLDIPFQVEHKLVRGLDYYTRTVFEIQPQERGSQNTICAGGRYDGLIQELGGPSTPGIGFAAGMERMVLNLKRHEIAIPEEDSARVVIAYLGDAAKEEALSLASRIRAKGVGAIMAPASKSLRAQMRFANSLGVPYTLILGEEEMKKDSVVLRDMEKGDQREMAIENVVKELTS